MDFTGIFAILIVIGGPIAIGIVAIIAEHKARQKKYELMVKAVEMGKSPEDIKRMFNEQSDQSGRDINRRLRRGIILIAVALGLAVMALIERNSFFMGGNAGRFAFGASAFLLFLGLAFIIIWFIGKPKAKP